MSVAGDRDALIDAIRAIIRRAVPAAREEVKWNAPSFATAEHFATFHLRAKEGVQLVLHLGARPRKDVDLREELPEAAAIATWKGPDRAVVVVRDAAELARIERQLGALLTKWSRFVR